MMNNNSNLSNNPAQPPNQNPTPSAPNRVDWWNTTQKILYLVAFIFSILTAISTGITGLVLLIFGITVPAATSGTGIETGVTVSSTVFIVLGVIFLAIMIWSIVATVFINRYRLQLGTEEEKPHLAFGICVLIFGTWISGILIIVASSLKQFKP